MFNEQLLTKKHVHRESIRFNCNDGVHRKKKGMYSFIFSPLSSSLIIVVNPLLCHGSCTPELLKECQSVSSLSVELPFSIQLI